MITRKEADKRIKLWGGDYKQTTHTRPDGFKFMRTVLFFNETKEVTIMDLIDSRNPEFKKLSPGSLFEKQIVADSFIHSIK